jgi:predicted HTH domain antitoxin
MLPFVMKNMTAISVDFPRDLIHILKVRDRELPRVLREMVAVELYKDGRISLGKAAEIAGVSKWEMFEILASKKIPLRYGVDDLKEDLKTLRELV